MPFTDQVTDVSGLFATMAVKVERLLSGIVANAGETLMLTLLDIVMIAEAPDGGVGAGHNECLQSD
jgi:hypothetical protein